MGSGVSLERQTGTRPGRGLQSVQKDFVFVPFFRNSRNPLEDINQGGCKD